MDFSHCKYIPELPMIAAIKVLIKSYWKNQHAKDSPSQSPGNALI